MKTYLCMTSCLVDDIVLKHYVRAKNERQAWIKGYVYFNYHCSVADGGTVDVKRVTDFSNISRVFYELSTDNGRQPQQVVAVPVYSIHNETINNRINNERNKKL